jgi:hypothetical protein
MRGPPPPPAPAPKRDKALAGTAAGLAPAPPPPPPAPPAVALDALDFTAPVTLNNPFGEGQVEVTADDLDFTATTPAPIEAFNAEGSVKPVSPEKSVKPFAPEASGKPGPRDKSVRLPSAMAVGAWVEILDPTDERKRPARLHYVSPMKSHFLFVDRKGSKVYECSRTMLARRVKLGEVLMLDGEPDASLFDRIVEGLFGKLRAEAPA